MSKEGRPGLRWHLWTAAASLPQHNEEFAPCAKALRKRPARAQFLNGCEPRGEHRSRNDGSSAQVGLIEMR